MPTTTSTTSKTFAASTNVSMGGVLVSKAVSPHPVMLIPAPNGGPSDKEEERIAALLESTTNAINAVWAEANESLSRIRPDTAKACYRVRATLHTTAKGVPDGKLRFFVCTIRQGGPPNPLRSPSKNPGNCC